jgi:antitoxin component of RelBE/YafQ-DinJ toxin-antitoxin module
MSGEARPIPASSRGPAGHRRLLTFRLEQEQRQRLRARLAREGRTMSEVVTHGLRQYVQHARHGEGQGSPVKLVLPERIAARLRELRSSGRSEVLSATLAALNETGWPLRPLADALGISRQAVQARVRRRAPAELRDHVTNCEPPPPFAHRRVASATGLRPHLTIKIDHALRASAHRAAADEGHSLTQVVEAILDRYLRHGLTDADQASRVAVAAATEEGAYRRRSTRIMRHASAASTGTSASKSP